MFFSLFRVDSIRIGSWRWMIAQENHKSHFRTGYSLNQSIRDGTCIWYIPWYFNIQISTSLSQILDRLGIFNFTFAYFPVLWYFPSWRMKMSRSHVKFCCWHISEPTVKLKAGKNSTPGQKIQNHNHLLLCCTLAKKCTKFVSVKFLFQLDISFPPLRSDLPSLLFCLWRQQVGKNSSPENSC